MSKAEIIVKYFRRQSLVGLFIQAFALTITIGLIDYVTGDEVTVDPFYSIPILFMVIGFPGFEALKMRGHFARKMRGM
jgi:hypothetical protein